MNNYWKSILENFLADQSGDWEPETEAWYSRRLRPFFAYLEGEAITVAADINIRHIKRFFASQKKLKRSWSTRNGNHTSIGVLFRWFKDEHHTTINVFAEAGLKRPRRPKRKKRTIPLHYIQRMIEACENETTIISIRDAAIMRLLISTGLRREEICNLNQVDIDLIDKEMRIVGKYDDERDGFPDNAALDAVQTWLYARPETSDPALFVSTKGNGVCPPYRRLSANAINRVTDRWKSAAHIPASVNVSPHKWRHTFATHYAANGGNAFELRDLLGHSDIRTTEIYVETDKKILRRKTDKFAPKIS